MRRRPPALVTARSPARPAIDPGRARRLARLAALLLAGAASIAPALAQTAASDLDPRRTPGARPIAGTAAARTSTRAATPGLRGSVAAGRATPLDEPPPPAARLDAGDTGGRLLDPDPLALEPIDGGPARAPAAQATRAPGAATAAAAAPTGRRDPVTGRPLDLTADPNAGRTPVGSVARTGTVRAGGPVEPQAATQPRPRDPLAAKREEATTEDDEFAQLGLRSGGFTWLPAVEGSAGWSSNIASKAGGASGMTYKVAPELLGRSDWSSHALQFELRGAYLGNTADHDYDKPTFSAAMRGRIDLGDETRIDLKAGWSHDRQAPSSSDNPADTVVPATVDSKTGSLGLTRDVGLLAVTLRGDVERTDYSGGTTASGASLGADAQNNTRSTAALRLAYGTPGSIRPFAEVQVTNRDYDQPLVSGSPRDATGAALKGGIVADLGPSLRGEISTGWGVERPRQGTLPDMSGWLLDGSLIWSPTRLTTVRLDAKTSFEPTTLATATGSIVRTVGVSVDHALRRDLVASAGVAFSDKRYVGASLHENTLALSSGLTYKVDRNIQTFVKGSLERFTSSSAGAGYGAAAVVVGVRLQR